MAKYHCTYCQNPITTCRIHCVHCSDFDLCLQCFACGAEAGNHKKEHDYEVHDDGFFGIFENTESWTSNEEEALLEAVEQYGFGNWEDTAAHVKTKEVEECKEHYYAFYMHGNIGKATFPTSPHYTKVKDHTCPEGGPLSPSLSTPPLPPLELTPQERTELGYMPLRDDFEREYDNDAETLVSSLSLNYDDEDIDIAFKIAQVDIYRQRLKERQRRKRIARTYGLIQPASVLNSKQKTPGKKKGSKDEREFQDKMKVFAQFHSQTEHDQLFENLQREKQIKTRIKELMRLRRHGITQFDEVADFEAERHRREKRKENKKKLASMAAAAKRSSMASKKAGEKDDGDETTIGDKKLTNGFKELVGMPGYELLSDRERRLCHSIRMNPNSYITIKTCIIKDYLQRRQGIPVKIRYPNHLDKTHRRKILNFLSENGWIGGVGMA